MRRFVASLAAAAAFALPAVAQAQVCGAVQLAANPFVGAGYRAFVRIDNSAFDLSCYYTNIGGGMIGFDLAPIVSVGSGASRLAATISELVWTTGLTPSLSYSVSSNLRTSSSASDFAFAFAAPLSSMTYGAANAIVGVTRASGLPDVTLVAAGSPSTAPLGGVQSYVVAQSNALAVSGGGTNANPFATNLGVDVGTSCTSGTACSYPSALATPNATISAWGTVVSYHQNVPGGLPTNVSVNGTALLEPAVPFVVLATPEPTTIVLLAGGLAAVAGVGVRRRRA